MLVPPDGEFPGVGVGVAPGLGVGGGVALVIDPVY